MLFNSAKFLVFFPIVVAVYYLLPHKYRWVLLLAASYYFYMSWKPEYALLIMFSTVIDYFAAQKMEQATALASRKKYLAVSLFANLGTLFAFKYFNFFSDSTRLLLNQLNIFVDAPTFNMLLPVGISFYTFQTLSYTIDVYRGDKSAEKHFGIFAVYVSFFPQLVAGPIERSVSLLPQFYEKHAFDMTRIASGLQLMTWGMFKKVVIADRIALGVDNVYNNPTQFSGVPLLVTTYLFAIQIYCDFSGYSDIAIGAARVLGFDLMENFRRPYFADSIGDFWRRWHISLSTWFRDYVYIPLGGNRVTVGRNMRNIMIVFVVSGLWHGANWTFVIWGALHGTYLLIGNLTKSLRQQLAARLGLDGYPRFLHAVRMAVTFNLVAFAWIFFRANTVTDALYIVQNLFVGLELRGGYGIDIGGSYQFGIALLAIGLMGAVQLTQEWGKPSTQLAAQPVWVRWSVAYALLVCVMLFGRFGVTEFIYFQF